MFSKAGKLPYRCISDYVRPKGELDYVSFFAVTAGRHVRAAANRFKEEGDYLKAMRYKRLLLSWSKGSPNGRTRLSATAGASLMHPTSRWNSVSGEIPRAALFLRIPGLSES
ncbi:vitamin B12 dependent-methionine synthase activation domain-containing protein [Bacillus licheniformis]|nr:vitamin B12 dependent-methionine synthase activation domain-containing protein [Bacillus licheniformis]